MALKITQAETFQLNTHVLSWLVLGAQGATLLII